MQTEVFLGVIDGNYVCLPSACDACMFKLSEDKRSLYDLQSVGVSHLSKKTCFTFRASVKKALCTNKDLIHFVGSPVTVKRNTT